MPPPSIDDHPPTGYGPEAISETSAATRSNIVHVTSSNITYNDGHILSRYIYENAIVSEEDGRFVVKPTKTQYEFKTETTIPRVG